MREILFRGKQTTSGEWSYGYIYFDGKKTYIAYEGEKDCIIHEVIPSTVGQYTGLTDKNGTKIFEGDIVKLEDYHGERIVYIFWGNSGSWFYGGDGYSDEYIFNSHGREVIGNIHDNPELLEEVAQNGG